MEEPEGEGGGVVGEMSSNVPEMAREKCFGVEQQERYGVFKENVDYPSDIYIYIYYEN